MDKIKIKINNWDKYLHRKDLKSLSWFRVNSDIMHNPKFHKIDPKAGWFFICLLGFCAKKMNDTLEYPIAYLSDTTNCDPLKCAKLLEKNGLVRICTDLYESASNITIHNITEHNKTLQNKTKHYITRSPDKGEQLTPKKLFDLWNKTCGDLKKVQKLNDQRIRSANASIKRNSDIEFWISAIVKARDVFGNTPKGEWSFGFDNLINDGKLTKLLEGSYDFIKTKHTNNGNNFQLREDLVTQGNKELYDKMMREIDENER